MAESSSLSDGRKALSCLPFPILSRVIASAAKDFGCEPGAEQIKKAIAILKGDSAHQSVSFSGGYDFNVDRDEVFFSKSDRVGRHEKNTAQTDFCITLFSGINYLPGQNIVYLDDRSDPDTAEKDIKDLKNIYKLYIQEDLASDKIKGTVFVRNRREGDKYRFGGMTRSVRKLMQSKKSSMEERQSTPIVCDGGGICFLPGFPLRDGLGAADGGAPLRFYFFKGDYKSEKPE